MNVAFEISPLITASGTFGDKSGVYRYMIMFLESYIQYSLKKDKDSNIVLFSFNRDLMKYPLNPDVIKLAEHPQVTILNKIPTITQRSLLESIRDTIIMDVPVLRSVLKIFNKLLSITKISHELENRINFHVYYNFLNKQFKKKHVKVVFHSDTGFFNMIGYKNVITIYDLTGVAMTYLHRDETVDLQRRKMRFARLYCDGIVCISKSTKKDLFNFSPMFREKKTIVCYPGLDKSFTKIYESSNDSFERIKKMLSTKKFNLEKKKYFLYYGTFEPRKNLLYLIRAFCDLVDEGKIPSDFKLVMAGGRGWGRVKNMITQYITENYQTDEEKNVIVLNYVKDEGIIDFIQNATCVVYPSLYEGFGLPVLESMSQGTPVICSNTSSLPEAGGHAVLYVNPHDFFDLKNKMQLLVTDHHLSKELSVKGIDQAKKFTWEKSAKLLYEFFQGL